jgi:hypothetical protein
MIAALSFQPLILSATLLADVLLILIVLPLAGHYAVFTPTASARAAGRREALERSY